MRTNTNTHESGILVATTADASAERTCVCALVGKYFYAFSSGKVE